MNEESKKTKILNKRESETPLQTRKSTRLFNKTLEKKNSNFNLKENLKEIINPFI